MSALMLNHWKVLKIIFIIGLLVRLPAPWNYIYLTKLSLVGDVPAADIAAQRVSVPV